MTIRWSAQALKDLEAIQAYIERDSEFYARALVQRIVSRVEVLMEFPDVGHPVHEYPELPLKEIHEAPYRIIYRVGAEVIEIVTLVHFRQRNPVLRRVGKGKSL